MAVERDILTPDQAAEYLQVNRETIYRYIRSGKLIASILGRSYRIPRRNLDLLLFATSTRPDIVLRSYSKAEVEQFLGDDRLTPEQQRVASAFVEKTAPSTQ